MYIYIYIHIHLSLSIYLSIYMSLSVSLSLYMYVCVYIYIYIHISAGSEQVHGGLHSEPRAEPRHHVPPGDLGKGQMGSALLGSLRIYCFFDRGTFWVLPLTYLYSAKRARAYLFPQSVEIRYFCSGPVSVDPVCPQPPNYIRQNTF